jgi:D-serine deaminase-like pyridoxal phosphate-dependent protein
MTVPTPTELKPELGAPIDEIETPAVVVDLDVMERNVTAYADFADEHDVTLRSHTKTHKTPAIAHWQATVGGGIVCQTLSEAEVMAAAGIDDVYLSYMVVGDRKLDRLVALSERVDHFATTVDGPGNLQPLQEAAARHETTVNAVLEVDVGLGRVGVQPGEPAVELARAIDGAENVRLDGVMGYEGHVAYGDDTPETEAELERRSLACMDELEATVEAIEADGIPVETVGVGSTATSRYSGKHPVVSEIHPGMYAFMDARLATLPGIEKEDCALAVHSTVISAPANDRVVVDAGSKSISLEVDHDPLYAGEDEGIRYANASEEHGWIDVADADRDLSVGDRLAFYPPHVCPTINLHDTIVGVRDGRVETVWSVQGRGKVK